MITELVIAGLTTYAYRKTKYNYTHKSENELENRWMAAMVGAGVKNKDEESATYELTQIIPTQYGFCCCVKIPYGLSFGDLIKLKPVIETNLGAICEFEKDKLENYATLKIIKNVFKSDYKPVKTKANEIFLGYKLDGRKYILDLNTNSHILIAGMTGSGKSFLFASIVTNLIYYNSKDIDIYLFQIMKGEIDIFRNCPSVKFTSDNENEILIMLKKLSNLIHKRSKQFTELGIKNISQWNKHFPNKRMKRIIIGAEEISFFMNEKNEHFEFFNRIVKAGRSCGIHFIGLTQRTTSANLGGNGELKSQLTVITAKQRGEIDSKNAIDVYDAAYLEPQEFIASSNEGLVKFMAPTIDEYFKILNKYVPEIIIPDAISSKEPSKEKPAISGGWHIPSEEEWKSIRDTIPEVTYIKQEEKIPVGQMKAPKKGKKNGVISLNEVRESVNA